MLLTWAPWRTPKDRLTGKWTGAPEVTQAVDAVVNKAAGGKDVNPLARGGAQFFGQLFAQATMSVTLDLRPSGTAFFSGNTQAIGMPTDSDGTWEIVSATPDIIQVRLQSGAHQLNAEVIFRDSDSFELKFDKNAATTQPTPDAASATTAPAEPQYTSILFKRAD
jgi:hypothetical protein